jgi:hypothetical protein
MKVTKTKKPKRAPKRSEFELTEACGLYLDLSGDVGRVKKSLGKGWTQSELRWYEETRGWPSLLRRADQQTNDQLIEDTVARRMDQLGRLRNVRIKLYRQIMPLEDGAPVRAQSMEGIAAALCKVVELERNITGDDKGAGPPSAGIFTFLRDRILSERHSLATRFEGAALGDSDDSSRFKF